MNGLDQQTAGTRYAQLGAQIADLALVLEAVNEASLSNCAMAERKAQNFTLERVARLDLALQTLITSTAQATRTELRTLERELGATFLERLSWLCFGR